MGRVIAFGQEVPQSVIDELIADGVSPEEITTEFIETMYFWEHLDAR